ncbi:MAG: EscR/YscR/HrcR family type III secretion system export apparatus protein [Deltaproteobacteria bacterium]|nr:EscR/YscR/HrcR family type III secretion system export apparatus protein [Deltaproteobacteria bacterium]
MSNLAVWALVAIAPLVVLTLTSFVKLSIVLGLLRNAIGAPDAPSGLVVTGIALVLTFFVMTPVAIDMVHAAATPPAVVAPGGAGSAGASAPVPGSVDEALHKLVPLEYAGQLDAAERAIEPLRAWLGKHASAADRETFVGLAKKLGRDVRGDELWVLAPAFIATELREAFAIAVLLFLPFLVIDLVVALGLVSLGLQASSPQSIALPFKLLLFVAVDGWRLLLESLLRGYV